MVRRVLLFIAFILLLFTALRIINRGLADSIVSFVRNFSFFSLLQAPGLSIQSFTGSQQIHNHMSGFVNDNILEWQIDVGQTSGSLDDLFTPSLSQTGIVSSGILLFPHVGGGSTGGSMVSPPMSGEYAMFRNEAEDVLLRRRIDDLEQTIDRLQRENAELRARLSSFSSLQQTGQSAGSRSRSTRETSTTPPPNDNEALYFFYETIR